MRPPTPEELGLSPRARVAALGRLVGVQEAARICSAVLAGDRDDASVLWLAGQPATSWRYEPWPRTWALRGLMYVWDDKATDLVLEALADDGWRVREMAAKVVRERELPAGHLLGALLADPQVRVRVAALRALAVVGEAENVDEIRPLLDDPAVADTAAAALAELARRLDRAW